jgi:SCY1-like protein 2
MLAAATNLFGKSSTLSAYNLNVSTPSPSSSSANVSAQPSNTVNQAINVGLWKVTGATHKTTGKQVSVWIFEKRMLDGIRADPSSSRSASSSKEWVVEQLKKEVMPLFSES